MTQGLSSSDRTLKRLGSIIALSCMASCDAAQDSPAVPTSSDPLLGLWHFQTEGIDYDADMLDGWAQLRGTLILTEPTAETPSGSLYGCELNVTDFREIRRLGVRSYDQGSSTARQSCRVFRSDDKISLISTVLQGSSDSYSPDNFDLTIIEPTRMTGRLSSGLSGDVTMIKAGSDNWFEPSLPPSKRAAAKTSFRPPAEYLGHFDTGGQYGLDRAVETGTGLDGKTWHRVHVRNQTQINAIGKTADRAVYVMDIHCPSGTVVTHDLYYLNEGTRVYTRESWASEGFGEGGTFDELPENSFIHTVRKTVCASDT